MASNTNSSTIPIMTPKQAGVYTIHHLTNTSSESDDAIIARILALLAEQPHENKFLNKAKQVLTMKRLAFGTAGILGRLDLESQTIPSHQVYKPKKDLVLTRLLLSPSAQNTSNGNLATHLVNGVQGDVGKYRKVWCFFFELDGVAAALWLLFVLIGAGAVGLAIGFGLDDVKLGLGFGTGLLAVLTAIQGALVMRAVY